MRVIAAAAGIAAAVVLLAACGGSSDPVTHHSAAVPSLTDSQGAAICNDLNAWIPQADNQDQPRFNSTLEADKTLAVSDNSALGSDLSTEDSDLQEDNSLALVTGTLYNQEGVSNTTALSSDCAACGVTLNWGS